MLWVYSCVWCLVCLVLLALLLIIGREIIRYDWVKALRQFRFSLTALLAVITSICIALAGEHWQAASGSRLSMPWPATFMICLVFFAIIGAIVHDFRGRSRRGSARQSALERYRNREQQEEFSVAPGDAAAKPASGEKKRTKWWLRRLPNRFRSIGHRVCQITRISSRYDRE